MNHPYIPLYVGDWRKDLAVQSLSYHHRGIWLELLLLMHCSEQRGKLVLAGRPMSNASLARLLGLSEGEMRDAISVLIESGVATRDQNGSIINRRMVREEELRLKRKQSGSIGGSKTQAKRAANPYQNTGTDIDNDIGVVSKEKAQDKVRAFAREEGISETDADWFFFKGEGNGWTNGGEPIRDWQATLRSWNRAKYLPSQKARLTVKPWQEKKPDPNQARLDREYEEAQQRLAERKRERAKAG